MKFLSAICYANGDGELNTHRPGLGNRLGGGGRAAGRTGDGADDHGRVAELSADLRRRRRDDGHRLRPARRHAAGADRRPGRAEGDHRRHARRDQGRHHQVPRLSRGLRAGRSVLRRPASRRRRRDRPHDGPSHRTRRLRFRPDAGRLSHLQHGRGHHRAPRARARRHRRQDHDLPALRRAGGERGQPRHPRRGGRRTSAGRTCCSSSSSSPIRSTARARKPTRRRLPS